MHDVLYRMYAQVWCFITIYKYSYYTYSVYVNLNIDIPGVIHINFTRVIIFLMQWE